MGSDVMRVRLHLRQILWVPETRPWSLTWRDAGRS